MPRVSQPELPFPLCAAVTIEGRCAFDATTAIRTECPQGHVRDRALCDNHAKFDADQPCRECGLPVDVTEREALT